MDPDTELLELFEGLAAKGFVTSRTMAAELNRLGHKAPKGGIWHQKQCLRVAERLARDYPDYQSPFVPKAQTAAPKAHRPTMIERLHARHLLPRLEIMRAHGVTRPDKVAALLNAASLSAFGGGRWTRVSAKMLIELAYPQTAIAGRSVKPVALAKKRGTS